MPINFACPQCGSQTVVADQYAGQTGPCAKCGKMVTVPALGAQSTQPPPRSGGMGTGGIVAIVLGCVVLGLLLCGGVMAALLIPAVKAAREAATRAQSMNNLKQIGLAFHNYHDTMGSFPPPYTVDADGKPLHSWRVLILPYIEQDALYRQIKLDEPWDSAHNKQFHALMPQVYRDLGDSTAAGAPDNDADYYVIVGSNTIFDPANKTSMPAISDGTANTLLVVEASKAKVNWMEPKDLSFDSMEFQVNGPAGTGINGPQRGGALVSFADGSVRMLNDTTPPQDVKAMATKNGGEAVFNQ